MSKIICIVVNHHSSSATLGSTSLGICLDSSFVFCRSLGPIVAPDPTALTFGSGNLGLEHIAVVLNRVTREECTQHSTWMHSFQVEHVCM